MAIQINLLPKEKEASKSTKKISGVVNKIALGLTVAFLIVAISGGATYYLLANRLKTLKEEQQTYRSNIQNLQSTEASLVLLKDRLQKTQDVLAQRTVENAYEKQQAIITYRPSVLEVEKSEVDVSSSKLKITMPESRDLLALLSYLYSNSDYQSLVIKELTFQGQTGYSLEMDIF